MRTKTEILGYLAHLREERECLLQSDGHLRDRSRNYERIRVLEWVTDEYKTARGGENAIYWRLPKPEIKAEHVGKTWTPQDVYEEIEKERTQ